MGRNVSRERVIVAQLTGVAAGYGHLRRCTHAEALAEIGEVLTQVRVRPGSVAAVQLLSTAAALYLREPTGPDDEAWWHPAALGLLVDAGADRHRAAAVQRSRGGRSARLAL